ncbi:MAG: hydantoinase/oxoprolinase family protein, partial [Betaproteobacteria bacterium]|nr:hydantoinase/oxoprolinase family protein [Betaproteobacteria bacterium]
GIVSIVENNMATAARIHVAEEGQDPRRYRLLAFGGAGPVHAYGLARILGISEVIFPRGAGVASAIGMRVAPRSAEFTRSYVQRLATINWETAHRILAELESRGQELLLEAGAEAHAIRVELAADMRYVGQGYEITVPLTQPILMGKNVDAVRQAFDAQYQIRFGRSLNRPVEVVSWRVRVLAAPVADEVRLEHSATSREAGAIGERDVYFAEAGGFHTTPVLSRNRLAPGTQIKGPAIIEESESTVVVGPGAQVTVDETGNLVMRLEGKQIPG